MTSSVGDPVVRENMNSSFITHIYTLCRSYESKSEALGRNIGLETQRPSS